MRRLMPCVPALLLAGASLASAGSVPATGPTARLAAAAPIVVATSLGIIAKRHNVDLGGGVMGVELTVPADIVGLAGQTLATVLWFYDEAGNPVRSNLDGWGDATNHLRVVSRDVSPASSREAVSFVFRVPYRAFPKGAGPYRVEARAVLLQRVGDGRRVLARTSTRFVVE